MNSLHLDAFNALYTRCHRRVYNLALHYVHNSEDAEEITQEVFVQAYKALPDFRERSSLDTWVYRITVNASLDFLRHKKRKKRWGFLTSLFGDSGELLHDIPEYRHPGVLLEQSEQAETLYKTIETLPDQQRTAFILKYIEDMTQQQIADILQISTKAVESLLHRAKQHLRAKLADMYNDS